MSLSAKDRDVILRVVRERRAGQTFTVIAQRMNAEGLLSPDGQPWSGDIARRVYQDATRDGLA